MITKLYPDNPNYTLLEEVSKALEAEKGLFTLQE